MKFDTAAYEHMKEFCQEWLKAETIKEHRAHLQTDASVKDLECRLRWDIFWYVWHRSLLLREAVEDLTNDHIDTALRRLMRELYPEVNNH